MDISGNTKTIALIGSPVEHSLSPAIHNTSFKKLGLDLTYVAYEVQPDEVVDAVEQMKALDFVGFNVTMPLKSSVLPLLDEVSASSKLMGAVNTVVLQDGKLRGHNTDGIGFMRNLAESGIEVVGKKMTIAGTGGAGSALYVQAAFDGVAEIDVYSTRGTTYTATEKRIEAVREQTQCNITLHKLSDKDDLRNSVAESTVFVNASRLGMIPLENECPLDEDMLHDKLAVADVVYNPRTTKLLAMAKAHGNPTADGLGMLLWQAAAAEKLWTGQDMPVDYVRNAVF